LVRKGKSHLFREKCFSLERFHFNTLLCAPVGAGLASLLPLTPSAGIVVHKPARVHRLVESYMGVCRLFSRGEQKFSRGVEQEPSFCLKNNKKGTIFSQIYYFWPDRGARAPLPFPADAHGVLCINSSCLKYQKDKQQGIKKIMIIFFIFFI
jgi:hypothetical protein